MHPYADGRRSVVYPSITGFTVGLIAAQGNDQLGRTRGRRIALPIHPSSRATKHISPGTPSPPAPPPLRGRGHLCQEMTPPDYFGLSEVSRTGSQNSPSSNSSEGCL